MTDFLCWMTIYNLFISPTAESLAMNPQMEVPSDAELGRLLHLAKRSLNDATQISPNDRPLCPETGVRGTAPSVGGIFIRRF